MLSLSFSLALALATAAPADPEPTAAATPAPPDPEVLLATRIHAPPPIVDGVVDPLWATAPPLAIATSVWEIAEFAGYGGKSYRATLRALYDDTRLYILAQWDDSTRSADRQEWYFDPGAGRWVQESGRPTFASGQLVEPAHYEDKLSLIWNIDGSVAEFADQGCMVLCHTGVRGHPFGKTALKHTNAAAERADMWHWKLVRTNAVNQADDQHVDHSASEKGGGRHGDSAAGGGYSANMQLVGHPAGGREAAIPRYYIPGRTEYNTILHSEIAIGLAVEIETLSPDGSLVDARGAVLAPTDFPRRGPSRIPSVTIAPFRGSRGDLQSHGRHDGAGWTVEIARAFETDDKSHDVQWSDRGAGARYDFGFAVFDNAQIAHATSSEVYRLLFEQR